MKPWPVKPQYMADYYQAMRYYEQEAAAAMARLRVAVEALDEIETESRQADDDNECADETHHLAMEALAAIGPLPELPPEGM
jgi:hypothetical protein